MPRMLSFYLLFLISSILISFPRQLDAAEKLEDNRKPIFEVVSRNINEDDELKVPEIHYYVIKKSAPGREDKNFRRVYCIASNTPASSGKCSVIATSDGKFLLADCFSHNSVCYSCTLDRYSSDGTLDLSFRTPFASSLGEIINGSPEHEIKDIHQITIDQNGNIRIDGNFISPLIGWSRRQAKNKIGCASGKDGIVFLRKDGSFNSFIPNKSQ